MKVVMILKFSATKSPFAKYFGLKGFFLFARKHTICCAATQGYHAQMYSTIQCVCMCVCLCGRTSGWKRIHLQNKKRIFLSMILLLWDTILWVTYIIQQFFYSTWWVCRWICMRLKSRGSRKCTALKGRQQGLEGVWQSQWAGIQYRLVCLFSGSFITAYTRSHAAGVRLIPFPQ